MPDSSRPTGADDAAAHAADDAAEDDAAHRPASSDGSRGASHRGLYTTVVVFYTALFFAVMWPIYPMFATIEPRVLSMPFSLVFVVGALLLSFFVLLGLYLWEEERGLNAPIDGDGRGFGVEPADREAR
ncbi:MAG: hypothetical protein R3195_17880 [Gemmatimonadota bacterium]|nr:hypothetical protein [Gemmatimonadota bacterium]